MSAMRKFLYLTVLVIAGMLSSGSEGIFVSFVYAEQGRTAPVNTGGRVMSNQEAGECVESVSVMRKNHMDFLFHQRDNTMYYGIRTKRFSLKGCISCHVQRDEQGREIPVNAKDQFCEDCHQYVAVNIDCFGCHAAIR